MEKAILILNKLKQAKTWEEYYPSNNNCKEAIEELEIIKNKSCLNCQYFQNETLHKEEWQECSMFYIETRDIANVDKFYCSEHKYIVCVQK